MKKPEISHQPPSRSGGRNVEAMLGQRRIEREPEELTHEQHRVPVHIGRHVEANDHKADREGDDRRDTKEPEIDRAKLRVADLADPVAEHAAFAFEIGIVAGDIDARLDMPHDLNAGEDVLIVVHHTLL
jgi:hypothetical protein